MIIETIAPSASLGQEMHELAVAPSARDTLERLLRRPGEGALADPYDPEVAYLLSVASSWAYSDLATFAFTMHRRGLPDNRACLFHIGNDALFVNAAAYLLQSACGRVGVLCFRGTQPANIIDWLADASVEMDPFRDLGEVHGGFTRNVEAIWPFLADGLDDLLKGVPLRREGIPALGGAGSRRNGGDGHGPSLRPLEAFYVAGHSLGGGLATLAAMRIVEDETLAPLRALLRGVYTYGQPMVTAPRLAERCERDFGDIVFRHVYGPDVVPRMPPITTGRFAHFGREYRAVDGHWRRSTQISTQARSASALVIGVLAWLKQRFVATRGLGAALPFSWAAHSPRFYMQISKLRPGTEFD